jgi:hypothetical protein
MSYRPVISYDLAHRTFTAPSSWRHCSPHIHRTEFVTSQNEQKESFQQYFYNRYKIVVYTGLRSDSIKNHASRNEALRIAAMLIIFTRIGCALLTCDMYLSDLRHIHDPVLSLLKMEGIRLLFSHRHVPHMDLLNSKCTMNFPFVYMKFTQHHLQFKIVGISEWSRLLHTDLLHFL